MNAFAGRVASPGVAAGILRRDMPLPPGTGRAANGLVGAIAMALGQLSALQASARGLGSDIVQFQIEMLEDERFVLELLEAAIAGGDAEAAVAAVLGEQIDAFAQSGSETFSARAADLADLRDRLLAALRGTVRDTAELPEGTILLVEELVPTRFLELDLRKVSGIVDQRGSTASHVALLARSEGIPMLVDTGALDEALEGQAVTLDAATGRLLLGSAPGPAELEEGQPPAIADREGEGAALTPQGRRIAVNLIVNALSVLEEAPPGWFDGIGLVRTELLMHDETVLTGEDAQAALYAPLFDWAQGKPVSIRLFDGGGDKPLPGLSVPREANPFLGVRGARLLMRHPEVVATQLRAILRAAAGRPVRILVPMVTLPAEMEFFRAALASAISALGADAGPDSRKAMLGMMVETPAAALEPGSFDADFFALGTNDLVQYTLAAARDSDALELGDALPEVVLALIRRVVEHGERSGREVTLCGDVSGRSTQLRQLLDCGVHSFSVPKRFAPQLKHFIRNGE